MRAAFALLVYASEDHHFLKVRTPEIKEASKGDVCRAERRPEPSLHPGSESSKDFEGA